MCVPSSEPPQPGCSGIITRNRFAHGSAKSQPPSVPAPCQNTSGSPSPAVSNSTFTPLTEIISR